MKNTFRSIHVCLLWPLSLFLLGVMDLPSYEKTEAAPHALSVPKRSAVPQRITQLPARRHQASSIHLVSRLPKHQRLQSPRTDFLTVQRLVQKKQPAPLEISHPIANRKSLDDVQLGDAPAAITSTPESEAKFLGEITIQASPSRSPSDSPDLALNQR